MDYLLIKSILTEAIYLLISAISVYILVWASMRIFFLYLQLFKKTDKSEGNLLVDNYTY